MDLACHWEIQSAFGEDRHWVGWSYIKSETVCSCVAHNSQSLLHFLAGGTVGGKRKRLLRLCLMM